MRTTDLAVNIDFSGGISDAWSSIARIIPKFLAFIVVMFIGWLIAKTLAKVLDVLLRRIGFERVADRAGVGRMLANSEYDATRILAKFVYYGVLLIALQLAFGLFGPNPISTMIQSVVAWLPRGFVALVIVVVAAAIARAVRDLISAALSTLSYGRLVGGIAAVFILGLGIIAALGQAGIATAVTGPLLTAVLASIAGVIIVGVGGGLIQPMRQRWERWLSAIEQETGRARVSMTAYQAGRSDARGSTERTGRQEPTR